MLGISFHLTSCPWPTSWEVSCSQRPLSWPSWRRSDSPPPSGACRRDCTRQRSPSGETSAPWASWNRLQHYNVIFALFVGFSWSTLFRKVKSFTKSFTFLPHQSLGFSFPGVGWKRSYSLEVVKARFSQRLVLDPDSLKVKVGGNKLISLVSLPGGPLEVCTWPEVIKYSREHLIRLTAVIIEVLQSCGVSIDKVEMVLQPTHLRGVPGLPQLPQSGYLVHQLPLLGDPERTEILSNYYFIITW